MNTVHVAVVVYFASGAVARATIGPVSREESDRAARAYAMQAQAQRPGDRLSAHGYELA